MRVSLFITCLVNSLRPSIGISTVKILKKLGVEVDFPASQTCCGQPAFNAGFWKEAHEVAEHFLDTFKNSNLIVAPSGSCVSMIRKNYPVIFDGESSLKRRAEDIASRTYELIEFITKFLKLPKINARYNGRVAYHSCCHLLRELDIAPQTRQVIQNVKGVRYCQMNQEDVCCGFGGVFSIKFPTISSAMTRQKVKNLIKSGADTLVTNDLGCLLQIEGILHYQNIPIKTLHIAELLSSE